ncbi:MAG: permease component of ribose/xylose/arabinose/galactoside ABC-type transporter [Clostridiales bacterium]|nr:permease component of ribose/xylose/arabinose/galactoside ABC-type transporter [Clostridiales bacterium]
MEMRNFWNTAKKTYSIYMVLFALFIVCSFANPNFLSANNLTNISRQLAVTTILAFGQTILIISGMLDLSQGSVLALSGVFAVSAYKTTGSLLIAVLVGILTGVICNLINVLMISTFKAPPCIATLAMLTMARGVSYSYHISNNNSDPYLVYIEAHQIWTITICCRRQRRSFCCFRY